jgi:hypothetical protein
MPAMDAVWLHPTARFNNGFIFTGCIFRNCSFQRITLFASIENYETWNNLTSVSWISVAPSAADRAERERILEGKPAELPSPKLIEHEEAEEEKEE